MGKAAAFVCAVVLGIVLVTSADTESSSATESAPIEENVLQNTTVPNGDETESSSNTNSQRTTKKPRQENNQRWRLKNKDRCYTKDLNYPGLAKPPEEYFNSRERIKIINCERGYRKSIGYYRITCNRGKWEASGTPGSPCTSEDTPWGRSASLYEIPTPASDTDEDPKPNKPVGRSASLYEIPTPANDTDEDPKPNTLVCGSPPDIEGAITPHLKDTEHPVGTAVTYSCPYGYVSRNSIYHVSVCKVNTSTGRPEWGTPEITCIPRSCGDPGYISNGRRVGNLFTFPFKVEYVCEEGYKLRGLSTRYCQAGGDWSGVLPTCDPIYCKVPENPPNGLVSYSSLEYGTELKYTCNTGYLPKKHEPRICSEDGNWSNEEPECIEATCEEPKPPKFGTVKLRGALKVGSLAIYSCDPGRMLYGATTRKCLITGQWTFDVPVCETSCQGPPPPANYAYPVIGSREHNFTIYYKCIRETIKIPGNVTCHYGSWIGTPPKCLYYPCYTKDLNYPGLAKPPEEYFDSRESFKIKCERGYRKTAGIYRITCNRGKWEVLGSPCTSESEESRINPPGTNVESSSPQPDDTTRKPKGFCTYAHKDSKVIVQTKHRTLDDTDEVKVGETVSLECESPNHRLKWKNGLIFEGKVFMTCSVCTQWQTDDLPICIPASGGTYITYDGHLKVLPGGIINMQKGESRRYECRVSSLQRREPEWDFHKRQNIQTATYEIMVNKELVYIAYLDILQASDQHNGEYECFEPIYHDGRVGSSFLRLQVYEEVTTTTTEAGVPTGGKVTQPSVNVETSTHQTSEVKPEEDCFCTYEYQHQDVVAHTRQKALTVGDMIRRGERVSFECKYEGMALVWKNGLRLTGEANLICSTCEKWKREDVPICQNYERSEAVITFTKDLNILPGGTTIVNKGDRNQFHCTSTLKFPEWDYGQRRGVSIKNSEIPVAGKTYYVSVLDITRNENAPSGEYECYLKDSYGQRIGSTSLHLQSYEADILCPEIDRSGIFTLSYSNQRRINSTVTFFCKDDDKRIEGHNSLTCLPNGTWSGQIPKCVDYVSCPEFTVPQGLTVTYSKNLSVGSIASFECSQPAKVMNGSNTSRCQKDGSWSNPLPFCEDQKCSINDLAMSVAEEVEPDMSEVTGAYVTLGFEVKLKCANKYIITGDGKAVCEKQGKWKIGSFLCVLGCILDLDPSSHLLVEPKKDGYRVGERISLSCPPGEELSSDVEQLMCLSSVWSDSLPDCVEPEKKPGV